MDPARITEIKNSVMLECETGRLEHEIRVLSQELDTKNKALKDLQPTHRSEIEILQDKISEIEDPDLQTRIRRLEAREDLVRERLASLENQKPRPASEWELQTENVIGELTEAVLDEGKHKRWLEERLGLQPRQDARILERIQALASRLKRFRPENCRCQNSSKALPSKDPFSSEPSGLITMSDKPGQPVPYVPSKSLLVKVPEKEFEILKVRLHAQSP